MAIIIEEKTGVTVRREVYAADIRIRANPVDQAARFAASNLCRLEYGDNKND